MGEFGSFSLTQNKIKIVFKGKKTKKQKTCWVKPHGACIPKIKA
jgi:hypothetical protein